MDMQRQPIELKRLVQGQQESLRLGYRPVIPRPTKQHGRVFVATQAGQHMRLRQRTLHACGNLLQQRVAGMVPQRVVDLLEPVEIDQHDGRSLRRGQRPLQLRVHGVIEISAVAQTGQVVARGVAREHLVLRKNHAAFTLQSA